MSSLYQAYPKRERAPYFLLNSVLYFPFRVFVSFCFASVSLYVFTIISFMPQVDYKALNRPAETNLNSSATNLRESINWLLKSVVPSLAQHVVHADNRVREI